MIAKHQNKKLVCDDNSDELSDIYINSDGLIVLKSKNDISDIIAVNYAYSIGADIKFVEPVSQHEIHTLQMHINNWKKNHSSDAYYSIEFLVNSRVGQIHLNQYQYVTFFTDGLPYGTILKNAIPFSHVHRSMSVDLFIFYNIVHECIDLSFGSAVIFSPRPNNLEEIIRIEDETLYKVLNEKNIYTKRLLTKDATVENLSNFAGHYPYDLLHISSYGGEIDGYNVVKEFFDRDGQKHCLEYDEVVGFSNVKQKTCKVDTKIIFRRLDGLRWMNAELEQREIPQYVFEDMRKAIMGDRKNDNIERKPIDYEIYSSCHIQCYDSIHQGQFYSMASNSQPVIFNNTCNSCLGRKSLCR